MRYVHEIKLTVFSKPEDDDEKIKKTLLDLIPFDIEKEKIMLDSKKSKGFNERDIIVYNLSLTKSSHINEFLKTLLSRLTQEQKDMLIRQSESRLDSELNFYIRLDKDKLMKGDYFITDSGNCFHIRMSVAAFPKKRENALDVVRSIIDEL